MRFVDLHHDEHVPESELSSHLLLCPLCGNSSSVYLFAVQHSPNVGLQRCTNCHGGFVNRVPSQAVLDAYYGNYYATKASEQVAADDPSVIGRRIASYLDRREALDVLDFGGGDGSVGHDVVVRVAESGSVLVVDYGNSVLKESDSVAVNKVATLDEVGDREGAFDLVIASAVLEHLQNPMPVLDRLIALLKPGGTLYVRTPDAAPVIVLAQKLRLSLEFGFPAHLFDLGQPFWSRIQRWSVPAARLEVVASRPSPVETTLRQHPLRSLIATALKWPWSVFGSSWRLVGGWEWVARRVSD